MTLLWKLLRSHLSVAQTVGFALAGVVGMTIVCGKSARTAFMKCSFRA